MSRQSLDRLSPVCVLGASRGIGAACVRQFAREGAREIHAVARNRAGLESLKREIAEAYPQTRVFAHAVDLMDAKATQAWLHALEDAGEWPRHWIVNVGGSPTGTFGSGSFESLTWPEIETMLRFNLELPLRLTHAILPELLRPDAEGRSEGSLIYISSQAGHFERPGFATYASAKAGLSHFAKSLFGEVRERGVRISVISPGMVDTPIHPDSPRFDRARFIGDTDVASSVAWVLAMDARTCPIEIHLRPQMDPAR